MSLKRIILAAICAVALAEEKFLSPLTKDLEGRIVNGNDAQYGQFPHQVSLQFAAEAGAKLQHFCGGSILTKEWILTAGHCVVNLPPYGVFQVKAGKHNISRVEDTEQTSRVTKIVMHKNYPGGLAPYDLALLKLQTPLIFTRNVRPISLPQPGEEPVGYATLSGWGSVSTSIFTDMPDILQTADLPLIDLQSCRDAFRRIIDTQAPLHSTNICTSTTDALAGGACKADSGGPLIQKTWNGQAKLIGVVSWGLFPCGSDAAPSVYVKVSDFVSWIEHVTTTS